MSKLYSNKKYNSCEDKHDAVVFDQSPRAFWGIQALEGYTIPVTVPGNQGFRPITVPAIQLLDAEDFGEKVFPDFPPIRVLQYLGDKPTVFKITITVTFKNDSNIDVAARAVLGRGKNGALPTELITSIKETSFIPIGQQSTELALGTLLLEPFDTITLLVDNLNDFIANQFSLTNFSFVVTVA